MDGYLVRNMAKIKPCANCGILIKGRRKYCGPCTADHIAEINRTYRKKDKLVLDNS